MLAAIAFGKPGASPSRLESPRRAAGQEFDGTARPGIQPRIAVNPAGQG